MKKQKNEALRVYARGIFLLAKSAKAFRDFANSTSREVTFNHELTFTVFCDGG
jgi:hypothetical protein